MRDIKFKSRSNALLTGADSTGGQGVHCEVESKAHMEMYSAVVGKKGEPVGQRWDKVRSGLLRGRRA
jgi:hypothetical protein